MENPYNTSFFSSFSGPVYLLYQLVISGSRLAGRHISASTVPPSLSALWKRKRTERKCEGEGIIKSIWEEQKLVHHGAKMGSVWHATLDHLGFRPILDFLKVLLCKWLWFINIISITMRNLPTVPIYSTQYLFQRSFSTLQITSLQIQETLVSFLIFLLHLFMYIMSPFLQGRQIHNIATTDMNQFIINKKNILNSLRFQEKCKKKTENFLFR